MVQVVEVWGGVKGGSRFKFQCGPINKRKKEKKEKKKRGKKISTHKKGLYKLHFVIKDIGNSIVVLQYMV